MRRRPVPELLLLLTPVLLSSKVQAFSVLVLIEYFLLCRGEAVLARKLLLWVQAPSPTVTLIDYAFLGMISFLDLMAPLMIGAAGLPQLPPFAELGMQILVLQLESLEFGMKGP